MHAMESDPSIVARVRAAAEVIAPTLDRLEVDRRLPPGAVDALAAAGVFKLCVPRVYGGAQASTHTMLAAIEELAVLDGSVGWCAMIGATSGLMSVYLDDEVARAIYTPADAITCGVFAPMGRAIAADGGYRVSGRWSFASGCEHSRWRMVGTIADGDAPLPSGAPDVRSILLRAEDTTIHDTWDAVGLRGTGSHDLSVDGVVVPRERTFSLITGKVRHDGYALPFFGVLAAGIAAVGIGIARAALASAISLVQTKKLPGGKKSLAHRELVQLEVARAEARVGAAKSLLHEALAAAVAAPDSIAARARLRVAACHAATESAAVASAAYELGGGAAVYAASPLQRRFRDAHVVTHHLMVSQTALVMAGRALLGVDVDTATL
jgi:alkylation response protein AidB-like acyl-CoA dehydrogenase